MRFDFEAHEGAAVSFALEKTEEIFAGDREAVREAAFPSMEMLVPSGRRSARAALDRTQNRHCGFAGSHCRRVPSPAGRWFPMGAPMAKETWRRWPASFMESARGKDSSRSIVLAGPCARQAELRWRRPRREGSTQGSTQGSSQGSSNGIEHWDQAYRTEATAGWRSVKVALERARSALMDGVLAGQGGASRHLRAEFQNPVFASSDRTFPLRV
jgi:hypothetical protein